MSVSSVAAQLQAVQRAVRSRTLGSGWSITNRGEREVLAQQAVRMERLGRRLIEALVCEGRLVVNEHGAVCARTVSGLQGAEAHKEC